MQLVLNGHAGGDMASADDLCARGGGRLRRCSGTIRSQALGAPLVDQAGGADKPSAPSWLCDCPTCTMFGTDLRPRAWDPRGAPRGPGRVRDLVCFAPPLAPFGTADVPITCSKRRIRADNCRLFQKAHRVCVSLPRAGQERGRGTCTSGRGFSSHRHTDA